MSLPRPRSLAGGEVRGSFRCPGLEVSVSVWDARDGPYRVNWIGEHVSPAGWPPLKKASGEHRPSWEKDVLALPRCGHLWVYVVPHPCPSCSLLTHWTVMCGRPALRGGRQGGRTGLGSRLAPASR